MKYKASRDIVVAVREIKTLSPSRIREWIREHRTEKVGSLTRQADVTPEAITMWFSRHRDIEQQLKTEVGEEELPKLAISEAIFQNGVFQEISSIKQWMIDLTNKGAKDNVIRGFFATLKRVCRGQIGEGNIEGWGLKHPDRLTLEDAKLYIYHLKKAGKKSRTARIALRNFLTSKGIVVKSSDISGEAEEDAGQFADLYVPKEKIYEIFDWLRGMNKEAERASRFAYKTGTRLSATLEADASYLNPQAQTLTVFEKASRGKPKRRMIKKLPKDLLDELPKEGKLFRIDARELTNLLRTAYKQIIPEIEPRIQMPFHFWRHMFAQHMLRATRWNYAIVAKLGGWTVEVLERYYGKMDFETALKLGTDAIENL